MHQLFVLFSLWTCTTVSVLAMSPIVRFQLDGQRYSIYVNRNNAYKMMVVPHTKYCDRTIIFHDLVRNVSIYKDITAETCFISPLYDDVVDKSAVLFKAVSPQYALENTPAVILTKERRMNADEIASLGRRAFLCINYATYRVRRKPSGERSSHSYRGIHTETGIVIGKVFAETVHTAKNQK